MSKISWLIEGGSVIGNPAKYLSVKHEQYIWVKDVDKAIRFCRREDAEMVSEIVIEDAYRLTEHMWMDDPEDVPISGRLPEGMKDHEVAQFVNELTTIAKEYGNTQQLREHISKCVKSHLEPEDDQP